MTLDDVLKEVMKQYKNDDTGRIVQVPKGYNVTFTHVTVPAINKPALKWGIASGTFGEVCNCVDRSEQYATLEEAMKAQDRTALVVPAMYCLPPGYLADVLDDRRLHTTTRACLKALVTIDARLSNLPQQKQKPVWTYGGVTLEGYSYEHSLVRWGLASDRHLAWLKAFTQSAISRLSCTKPITGDGYKYAALSNNVMRLRGNSITKPHSYFDATPSGADTPREFMRQLIHCWNTDRYQPRWWGNLETPDSGPFKHAMSIADMVYSWTGRSKGADRGELPRSTDSVWANIKEVWGVSPMK